MRGGKCPFQGSLLHHEHKAAAKGPSPSVCGLPAFTLTRYPISIERQPVRHVLSGACPEPWPQQCVCIPVASHMRDPDAPAVWAHWLLSAPPISGSGLHGGLTAVSCSGLASYWDWVTRRLYKPVPGCTAKASRLCPQGLEASPCFRLISLMSPQLLASRGS